MDELATTGRDLQWANEEDPKKRAEAAWECITLIEREQEATRMNDLMHASFYGNVEQFGFSPRSPKPAARQHARVSLNVVRNMTNTVVSKIAAKNKVHPKFITNDGEPSLERKAKDREKAVSAIFNDQKFYRKQRLIFRDICVFGTGFIRPWMDEQLRCVTLERIPKTDVLVSNEEGHLGDPSCLYYRKWYDKRVLAKLFPGEANEKIIEAAGKRSANATSDASVVDIVPTYECFHRPTRPGGEDGKRIIVLDSGELANAPWPHDYHPFAKLCWVEEPYGFFGTGLAYELAGIQDQINELLLEFVKAHRLIKGGWLTDRNAKIALKHINDDLGKIIQFTGTGVPPTYIQPVAIPQDTYRFLWDLYAKAFEIAGISQMGASGLKPAGLNSGEAQRVYLDEQTERFLDVGEALQDWTLDVTEQVVDRISDLAKTGDGLVVHATTERGLETIKLSDDFSRDDYRIQVFPTSMLPQTPAGRLAFINDMMQIGLIKNPADGMKLLGWPDTEAFMSEENAPRELLARNMEAILERGKWRAPEPLDDHDLALAHVPKLIARARNRGAPKENLSMARRYIVLTVRLKKLAETPDGLMSSITQADPNAAAPPPQPGPAGPPPPVQPGGEPLPQAA